MDNHTPRCKQERRAKVAIENVSMRFVLVGLAVIRAPFLVVFGSALFVSSRVLAATPEENWARNALIREANYIVNCSFTEQTANKGAVSRSDAAYGTINVNRISSAGPD